MTEDELRLRRIQDHRRCLEAGLVDQFVRQRHHLLWHDIEEIIADLRYVEDLIREKIAEEGHLRSTVKLLAQRRNHGNQAR